MSGFFRPVTSHDQPVGFRYDDTYGLYVAESVSPEYFAAPVENVTERYVNGVVVERVASGCYWLKPMLLRREKYGDFPQSAFLPVHVTMSGTVNYGPLDLVPVSGTYVSIQVDSLETATVVFPADMTMSAVAAMINARTRYIHPDYGYVARVGASGNLVLGTETPQFNPRPASGNRIYVEAGTAALALGLTVGGQVVGDIPPEYDNYENFFLLIRKADGSATKLESYIPVAQDNMLIKRAMSSFDSDLIAASRRLRLFFDGIAWALDCAEREVDRIVDALDADRIDERYLYNVARTLGYDLAALGPITPDAKRDVVKNIVNVYRAKGTPWSFDVMFRFIEYMATVWERTSDASRGYPLIVIQPDADDVTAYYDKFLRRDDQASFFDQFNWWYASEADSDVRMTAKQWWRTQIVSGLDPVLRDAGGNDLSPARMVASMIGPWDLSRDKGEMTLSAAAAPALVAGEDAYVGITYVGRVVRAITPLRYELDYRDGILDMAQVGGPVTGSLGGGSATAGIFDLFNPNDALSVEVDGRYAWIVDFSRYPGLYSAGQRQATSDEVEQALQLSAAEQGVPVDVAAVGDSFELRSRTIGPSSRIRITRTNLSLGLTENDVNPAVPSAAVSKVAFAAGSARVPFGADWVDGSMPSEQVAGLAVGSGQRFYFYLPDRSNQTGGMIIPEGTIAASGISSVARVVSITLLASGDATVQAEPRRDDYREPYVDELTEQQYEQLRVFVRYRRNSANYWLAAGRPSAGQPGGEALQHPWVPPDMAAYPGLGNSIFVRLDLRPFYDPSAVVTQEDVVRILALAEFLRPIHVALDIVLTAFDAKERIIDLPYDPTHDLGGAQPEPYGGLEEGSNAGFFWDDARPGVSEVAPWFFPWLAPHPDWTGPWPQPVVEGYKPRYAVPPPAPPYYVDREMNPLPAPPWVIPPMAPAPAPHRLAMWTYEGHWYNPGNPDVVSGALNPLDMAGHYPTWDVATTGGVSSVLMRVDGQYVPPATVLNIPNLFAFPTFLEYSGKRFDAFKPEEPLMQPRAVVALEDELGSQWYGYVGWSSPFSEPPARMYVFRDPDCTAAGWFDEGGLPGVPSPGVHKLVVLGAQAHHGEIADRLEVSAEESLPEEYYDFPPFDVLRDRADKCNCNLYPETGRKATAVYVAGSAAPRPFPAGWLLETALGSGTVAFDLDDGGTGSGWIHVSPMTSPYAPGEAVTNPAGGGTVVSVLDDACLGPETFAMNRTLGWLEPVLVSTGNAMLDRDYYRLPVTGGFGYHGRGVRSMADDIYPLIVLKSSISLIAPSFDNAGGTDWAYDDVSGRLQYAAPVDLSAVRPGDFFHFGPPFDPDFRTVVGVDDAGDGLWLLPRRWRAPGGIAFGTGIVYRSALRDHLATNLQAAVAADWVSAAPSDLTSYDELTNGQLADQNDKWYITGVHELVNGYDPTPFVAATSPVNFFGPGVYFVGGP